MSETRETTCDGCDQIKTVPLIPVEDVQFEGICAECEQNYGMQVGDLVRLREPDEHGDTEVMFVHPEVDAIRVRSLRTGQTKKVAWSEFEKIK